MRIKEIAELAGVSIGTVDRVIHNRIGVSTKTREKILKIIKETGYRKNVIASRLNLAARRKFRIATLIPEINHPYSYWKLPKQGIEKAIIELKEQGISNDFFHFQLADPSSFLAQMELIFSEDFDAIITVPFLENESIQLLTEAKEKEIAVVFLDTERPLNIETNYIRQNSFKAGQVAGRLLHSLIGDEGLFFVVNIASNGGIQINNQQRENGFRAYCDEHLKNHSIFILTINPNLKQKIIIPDTMLTILKTDISKGIFVTNARSFLLPPIFKENNIKNTSIVGFDLNQKNLQCLESGEISFLINQKPEYQGYSAIKGLYKYLTEKDISELNLDIPVEIIVKENAY